MFQFIDYKAGMSKGGDLNETPRGHTHRKLHSGQRSGLINLWHKPSAEGQAKRRQEELRPRQAEGPALAFPPGDFADKIVCAIQSWTLPPPCFWSVDMTVISQLQKAGKRPWLPSPAFSKDLLAVPCCTEVSRYEGFIIITKHATELHHK